VEIESDSQLMRLIQGGDNAPLAALFERYHLALFKYLFYLTRDRAQSEDLVQEVFFRILKYARSYDVNLPFSGWLYGMARNVYLDSVHKHRGEVPATEMGDLKSPEPIPEELFARKVDTERLREALMTLPEDKREVLVLSRFHDLRYEEIARMLGCEVGAVKVRVYRALRQLRENFLRVPQRNSVFPPSGHLKEKLYDV
jgi:RNA polymerase sigma-70 factor (ECF subfamily)